MLIIKIAASVCLLMPAAAPPVLVDWISTPVPFGNAKTRSLAPAPSLPGRVYLGALENGVYRTDDYLDAWEQASGGLPYDFTPTALAVSPTDAADVMAGGDGVLFRTTDAGRSWTSASEMFTGGLVRELLRPASDPSVVLASIESGTAPGVYRSTDQGQTWAIVPTAGADVAFRLREDPATPGRVAAGGSGGLRVSTDAGASWAITPIAAHASRVTWSADGSLHVATGGDLLTSTDGGATFSPTGPLPGCTCYTGITQLAASYFDEAELFGAGRGYCHVLPVTPSVAFLWGSEDGGESWSGGGSGNLTYFGAGPIQASATLPWLSSRGTYDVLFGELGNQGNGLFSSHGFGSNGASVQGLANYEVRVVRGDASGAVVAFVEESNGGVVVLPADGSAPHFARVPEDVLGHYGLQDHVFDVNLVTGNLQSWAHFSKYDTVGWRLGFRSVDGGFAWSHRGTPTCLELITNHGDDRVVYARSSYRVYRSDDYGVTLEEVAPLARFDFPVATGVNLPTLVKRPDDPLHVYGLRYFNVLYSTDGGETWLHPADGRPSPSNAPSLLRAIFVSPQDGDYVVVVGERGDVYESRWAANSWTKVGQLPLAPFEIRDATWNHKTGHVYIATNGGGVMTTNPVADLGGLDEKFPNSVHFSQRDGGTLFVGTRRGGLYQAKIPRPTEEAPEHWRLTPGPKGRAPGFAASGRFEVSPNPFTSPTTIRFALDRGANVQLDAFDIQGRRVQSLVNRWLEPGQHTLTWDGRGASGRPLPSGVYFLKMRGAGRTATERVVRLD